MKAFCAYCGGEVDQPPGAINRARKAGLNIYCGRRCASLGRRTQKTAAQRKEEKRLYDISYRRKNRKKLLAQKKKYHRRTYDPVKAAVERKKNMKRHVQYCRRPEYKRWKSAYDRRYRAIKFYGDFAETAMLYTDLNREIKERMTNYEIAQQNQTYGKRQIRQRAEDKDRPRRHRDPGP